MANEDMLLKTQKSNQIFVNENIQNGAVYKQPDAIQNDTLINSKNLFADKMQGNILENTEAEPVSVETTSEVVKDKVLSSIENTSMSSMAEQTVNSLIKVKEGQKLNENDERLIKISQQNIERAKEIAAKKVVTESKPLVKQITTSKDIASRLLSDKEQKLWGKMIKSCKALLDDTDESSEMFANLKKSIANFLIRFNKFPMEKESEYMNEFVIMRSNVLAYFKKNDKTKFSRKGRRRRDNSKTLLLDMENLLLSAPQYIRISYGICQENDIKSLCAPETKELYKKLAQDTVRKQDNYKVDNKDTIRKKEVEKEISKFDEWSFRSYIQLQKDFKQAEGVSKMLREKLGMTEKDMDHEFANEDKGRMKRIFNVILPNCKINADGNFENEETVNQAAGIVSDFMKHDLEQRKPVLDSLLYKVFKTSIPEDVFKNKDKLWENFDKINENKGFNQSFEDIFYNNTVNVDYINKKSVTDRKTLNRIVDKYAHLTSLSNLLIGENGVRADVGIFKNISEDEDSFRYVISKNSKDGMIPKEISEYHKTGKFNYKANQSGDPDYGNMTYLTFISAQKKLIEDKSYLGFRNYENVKNEIKKVKDENFEKLKKACTGGSDEELLEAQKIRNLSIHVSELQNKFLEEHGYMDKLNNHKYFGIHRDGINRCVAKSLKPVHYNDDGFPLTVEDCLAEEWNSGYVEAILSDDIEKIKPYIDDMYGELRDFVIEKDMFDAELFKKSLETGGPEYEEAKQKAFNYFVNNYQKLIRYNDLALTLESNVLNLSTIKGYHSDFLKKQADYDLFTKSGDALVMYSGLFIIPLFAAYTGISSDPNKEVYPKETGEAMLQVAVRQMLETLDDLKKAKINNAG